MNLAEKMNYLTVIFVIYTALVVVNGETIRQTMAEIASAIEKTSISLNTSMTLINTSNTDYASARKVNQDLAEHGGRFYDGLKIFAENMYKLMRMVENDR